MSSSGGLGFWAAAKPAARTAPETLGTPAGRAVLWDLLRHTRATWCDRVPSMQVLKKYTYMLLDLVLHTKGVYDMLAAVRTLPRRWAHRQGAPCCGTCCDTHAPPGVTASPACRYVTQADRA
jgi:hypothetical protein